MTFLPRRLATGYGTRPQKPEQQARPRPRRPSSPPPFGAGCYPKAVPTPGGAALALLNVEIDRNGMTAFRWMTRIPRPARRRRSGLRVRLVPSMVGQQTQQACSRPSLTRFTRPRSPAAFSSCSPTRCTDPGCGGGGCQAALAQLPAPWHRIRPLDEIRRSIEDRAARERSRSTSARTERLGITSPRSRSSRTSCGSGPARKSAPSCSVAISLVCARSPSPRW